jgi:magnesium transporter
MLGDPAQQGFVERSIYGGLQSLGQNLLTLPAAVMTGNPTMAVIVRALAIGQMTTANTRRTISREAAIALLNGTTMAVLLGTGVALIFADPLLGGVIAAATLFNLLIAGFAGVLVPLGLKRAGVDPAVASSVFVTMITDSMGFLLFLGLASASGLVH